MKLITTSGSYHDALKRRGPFQPKSLKIISDDITFKFAEIPKTMSLDKSLLLLEEDYAKDSRVVFSRPNIVIKE